MADDKTTHQFQAAVTRVLSLVINSLYSNKEIFLRELVSNASDALDKLRFRGIGEPNLLEGEPLRIRLSTDEKAGTLTISDSGVGMTREELEQNLGTVAHSGSQEFLSKLEQASQSDVNLIGQFGVGFYSAYLVADRVEVVTRAAGTEDAYRWASDGKDSFTIEPATRATRGTDLVLHLKADQKDFLKAWTLKGLVKRYSDYIEHPIELLAEKSEGTDDDSGPQWDRINEASALWQRPTSEITDAQYQEFYKHLTHDWEPPLAHRHFRLEGTQMFVGLLFVPAKPPFDLFSPDMRHGVRLHVKRVFIMDDCDELLPKWLRFVRGVVDSEDLPLNVSRELLQDSSLVRTIRRQVVKNALDMIEQILQGDQADVFWAAYGAVLKEGLHFDAEYRETLSKLVRFQSTQGEGLVSLADYASRMKEGQPGIYYSLGPSRAMVENSPHLEGLKSRGYEVLLMTDAVDEFAVQGLREYEGKPLLSALDADLKLGDDQKEDDTTGALGELLTRFRVVLQEQVSEVRVSSRLTDSPVCLVLPSGGLPPYLERLMRLQNSELPKQKRLLELNPDHALIQSLQKLNAADDKSERVTEWIELLYDQALLAEGSPLENPARLVGRITGLVTEAAGREAGSDAGG